MVYGCYVCSLNWYYKTTGHTHIQVRNNEKVSGQRVGVKITMRASQFSCLTSRSLSETDAQPKVCDYNETLSAAVWDFNTTVKWHSQTRKTDEEIMWIFGFQLMFWKHTTWSRSQCIANMTSCVFGFFSSKDVIIKTINFLSFVFVSYTNID